MFNNNERKRAELISSGLTFWPSQRHQPCTKWIQSFVIFLSNVCTIKHVHKKPDLVCSIVIETRLWFMTCFPTSKWIMHEWSQLPMLLPQLITFCRPSTTNNDLWLSRMEGMTSTLHWKIFKFIWVTIFTHTPLGYNVNLSKNQQLNECKNDFLLVIRFECVRLMTNCYTIFKFWIISKKWCIFLA